MITHKNLTRFLTSIWSGKIDENLSIKLYAKNLGDEKYLTGFLNSASNGGRFGNYSHPRVLGVQIISKL